MRCYLSTSAFNVSDSETNQHQWKPPEVLEGVKTAINDFVPIKSGIIYQAAYFGFINWYEKENAISFISGVFFLFENRD
jgi:hypothetical protein